MMRTNNLAALLENSCLAFLDEVKNGVCKPIANHPLIQNTYKDVIWACRVPDAKQKITDLVGIPELNAITAGPAFLES